MTTDHIQSDDSRSPATSKKPYEKPSFRYEQVFVTTALSCGKIYGLSGSCNQSGGKSS